MIAVRFARRAGTALAFLAASACSGGSDGSGPTAGHLRITTSTTGEDAPVSFRAQVGAATPGEVSDTEPMVAGPLPADEVSVLLLDVPENCTVAGGNPRTVTVVRGDTTAVAFAVGCTTTRGSVRVVLTTTGAAIDRDGYAIAVDGSPVQPIGVNDSVTFTNVLAGERALDLGGIAQNCVAASPLPGAVTVTAGAMTRVPVSIACDVGVILFTSRVEGPFAGQTQVTAVNPDGTGLVRLTNVAEPVRAYNGIWSPDASAIVYTIVRDGTPLLQGIERIDVDGTGHAALTDTTTTVNASVSSWSHGGEKLLYLRGLSEIWTMSPDGSGKTRIPTSGSRSYRTPLWGPNDEWILYASRPEFSGSPLDFYRRNVDGSDEVRLTTSMLGPFLTPCGLSPDGSRILFHRDARPDATQPVNYELFVVDVDGTNLVRLTTNPAEDVSGCWSPDGARIVFGSDRLDGVTVRLHLMNADGSDVAPLPGAPAGTPTDWR